MDLNEFGRLFKAGKPVQAGTITGLVGRILRGKDAHDFVTTTNDLDKKALAQGRVVPNRPLVLLVDSDALGDLIGIANSTYSMLHKVGYAVADIEKHAKEGLDFKLVVFEANGSSLATLGTWDNVIELAKKLFPQVAQYLEGAREGLKRYSFDEILQFAGDADWAQVDHDDVKYMDANKLRAVFTQGPINSVKGTVVVRRFLFDTLHLRRLYRGDGFTYNAAGQRGVPEYMVPTSPLTGLGKYSLIDLPKLALPKSGGGTIRQSTGKELDVPDFYSARNAGEWGYSPNLDKLLDQAAVYRKKNMIKVAASDTKKVIVLDIDSQKDFCMPQGTLYVAGRTGSGAIDDTARFTEFKYRNLGRITSIVNTMDTHPAFAIHTRSAWIAQNEGYVAPFTNISLADIEGGKVRPNPVFAGMLGVSPVWLDKQVRHYAAELLKGGQYALTVWTTHCVFGGDGYALTGLAQEVRLFHSYVRGAQNDPEIKGGNPLTENYGVMAPEVMTRWDGASIAQKNTKFLETLLKADVVVIGGQASSHCVRSSISQILDQVKTTDPSLAKKVYILRDCMSAVVTPVTDYTPEAEAALKSFEDAGMHVVKSTTPMEDWPEIHLD